MTTVRFVFRLILHFLTATVVAMSLAFATPVAADVRPDEMVTRTAGSLEFHYPERFHKAAQKLIEDGPAAEKQMAGLLGMDELGPVEVWILPEVDDYFELLGQPNRAPDWAVGLSLSGKGVVIVVNGAGPGGELVDSKKTFRHELAHVAIDRARGNHPVPRWFNEGFALLAADEWNPERADVFGRAASAGALKNFEDIERNFPEHSASAGLAYAQSLQFIMHLRDLRGDEVTAEIMKGVREGKSFEDSFKSAVGSSLKLTEAKWRNRAESQMSGWSILNDGTWGLFAGSLLFIVAFIIRSGRKRRRLAAMGNDGTETWDYEPSRYPLPGGTNEQ